MINQEGLMSRKQDYQLKKWQCLVKECRESGMKVRDWCIANNIPKSQYYYWLGKVRTEFYEEAVNQLQETTVHSNAAVPVRVQNGSFVEIRPEMVREVNNQENLSQPAAVIQKGSIRIEIMTKASTSLINQLLETVRYA
jgi:hypothetical protein